MKWIGRIILLGFIITILFIVGVGGFSYLQVKAQEPPQIKDAQWLLQTYSQDVFKCPARVYYTNDVKLIDKRPVIFDYWSYDGARYKHYSNKQGKELPENTSIMRRK